MAPLLAKNHSKGIVSPGNGRRCGLAKEPERMTIQQLLDNRTSSTWCTESPFGLFRRLPTTSSITGKVPRIPAQPTKSVVSELCHMTPEMLVKHHRLLGHS